MAGFTIAALAAVATFTPASVAERTPAAGNPETVLVTEFEVGDQGVNAADDAEIASLARKATGLFRKHVEADDRFTLVKGGGHAEGTDARSRARSSPCRTSSCLREVARSAGATRVVRGRYVKVSNLIRYLAVELVDPSTGRVLRSAAVELKGQRDAILDRAVSILYERLHPPSAELRPHGSG